MKFTKKVLDNGLTILHEKRDVPVTTVMLAVKHGAAYETEVEKGMSHFMEHMCFKGTEKRDNEEIIKEIEKVGGIANAFTDEDITAFYSKIPSEHFDIAMEVICDVFFNPTFPKEEVRKEAGVIIEEMKMIEDTPQRRIYDQIKKCMYTEPFGLDIIGSRKTVLNMTQEKLLAKHRKIYFPANSILCVVGNTSFDSVLSLAHRFVVERKGSAESTLPITRKVMGGRDHKKDLNQAHIALGLHFPKATDAEAEAAEVFSIILGRGMSSKLFLELRERRGLAYHADSIVELRRDFGAFIIYVGTDPSHVQEVISVCKEEYEKMGEITSAELEAAKIQLIGNKHIALEDSEHAAIDLVRSEIAGNAEDTYTKEKRVQAVMLEDIKKLAEKTEFSSFVIGP